MHGAFENTLSVVERELGLQSAENEDRTAGYFAKVSMNTEMRKWMCVGTHRSVPLVSQSWVKKWGRVGVVALLKAPPYFVIVARREIFHAGSACSDGDMEVQVRWTLRGITLTL